MKKIFITLLLISSIFLKNTAIADDKTTLIPKTIHQIWVGNKKLPKLYQAYAKTWLKHNKNWQYKLWTDKDVKNWQGEFYLKDLYDRAYTAQEKADILRLNVIYKYGGLYVDTDLECLKNFDPLHEKYEFYTTSPLSIFASKPNNPIFLKIFNRIRQNWDVVEKRFMERKKVEKIFHLVTISTERCQGSFSAVVSENISQMPRSAILPENQFIYPLYNQIKFCTKLKLIKFIPYLTSWSKDLKTLSNAMSAEKWGEIRDTTTYNNITDKVSVRKNNWSISRKTRHWFHENIDPYFVGCN